MSLRPLLFFPDPAGTLRALIVPRPIDLDSYQHSIVAQGGFEALALDFRTDPETALWWQGQLGASILIDGPEAETVWEGMLTGVRVTLGQERIDLSLDGMANAVKVRYQPDIGATAATAFATNAASIAQYGRKDLVYSGSGMTAAGAAALRDTLLTARADPTAARASTVVRGRADATVAVTLTGTGFYFLLDWLTTSSTTTATAVTTTYLMTLVAAYNAVNNWFAPSTANITPSGVSETQWIDADTTYRDAIERLLSIGNSSAQRQAYGVYEGRTWAVKPWAGASPTTVDYQRNLGSGDVLNAAGVVVQPWMVRPDAMYQVVDLLDPAPAASAADAAARYYVERVTCTVDRQSSGVRLEPAAASDLDVLLARLG